MLKNLTLVTLVLFQPVSSANAEIVSVKYRGEVPLDTFQCATIGRSSLVKRVCYDAAQNYMVILLKGTYYHYCEIGQGTVNALLAAALWAGTSKKISEAAAQTGRLTAEHTVCRCIEQ